MCHYTSKRNIPSYWQRPEGFANTGKVCVNWRIVSNSSLFRPAPSTAGFLLGSGRPLRKGLMGNEIPTPLKIKVEWAEPGMDFLLWNERSGKLVKWNIFKYVQKHIYVSLSENNMVQWKDIIVLRDEEGLWSTSTLSIVLVIIVHLLGSPVF